MENNKAKNERRYFRVAKNVLIKVIALFNEDHAVEEIGLIKDDLGFLISYTYNDGPMDVKEEEDYGININHRISVSSFCMSEFVESLNIDFGISNVMVIRDYKDELVVLYLHGDTDDTTKLMQEGKK